MPGMTRSALVLAAGLGTRMRPLTDRVPKPLVPLAGRPLIDHVLDRLAAAGITRAAVNVHYLAGQLEAHLRQRSWPAIVVSDERAELLDTGGGLLQAVSLLEPGPVLVHNSDSVWIERGIDNLSALIAAFDPARMDALLLLADRAGSLGYDGRGDFHLRGDGRLARVAPGGTAPFVFAGASIAAPRLWRDAPTGAFSLNRLWDRAEAEGRLYGIALAGTWMHVGDPGALTAAETLIAAERAHATGGTS